jgi:hypothetical protein
LAWSLRRGYIINDHDQCGAGWAGYPGIAHAQLGQHPGPDLGESERVGQRVGDSGGVAFPPGNTAPQGIEAVAGGVEVPDQRIRTRAEGIGQGAQGLGFPGTGDADDHGVDSEQAQGQLGAVHPGGQHLRIPDRPGGGWAVDRRRQSDERVTVG